MRRSWSTRFGFLLVLVALTATRPGMARDLLYQPVNPAFGGSPLNGPYLLGLAQANNFRYTQDPRVRREQREREQQLGLGTDPVQQFQRQITASILSQIAATIGQQILGENARDSGVFSVGGTQVQFNRVGGQINIDIFESATGGRTNIQIPVPAF